MKVKVEFTPMGSQIKWRLRGQVFCERGKCLLRKSMTLKTYDGVIRNCFGTRDAIKRFIKRNRKENRVIEFSWLDYDKCDKVI